MSSFKYQRPPLPSPGQREVPERPPRRGLAGGSSPSSNHAAGGGALESWDAATCLLRFACEPGSNLLDDVHQFVTAYSKLRFRPVVAQRLAVAAYELFANALSYGSVSNQVVFELLERSGEVGVRVSNAAITARAEMLRSHLTRLSADPEATFVEEMRRYVGGGVARAMLGLARVRHEAQMTLEYEVDQQRVVVVASCAR